MPRALAIAVSLLVTCGPGFARQATFQGLGVLPGYNRSIVAGLSADGTTVVGDCNTGTAADYRGFRWTSAGGMEDLGVLQGGIVVQAKGVNADGTIVVGRCVVAGVNRPFVWTVAGGMQELAAPAGSASAIAEACNADGSVIAGTAIVAGVSRAFRWTPAGGAVLIPTPAGWSGTQAWALSSAGGVLVGTSPSFMPPTQAFRWTPAGGTQPLGALPSGYDTYSVGVSGDGAVIVITGGNLAMLRGFKWIATSGFLLLPAPGAFTWSAHAASADGGVIGGGLSPATSEQAYVWTPAGNSPLAPTLAAAGANLDGWTLTSVRGVSADGRRFAGFGTHAVAPGQTREEAWFADLGPACYPDCNHDNVLTISDFGCFQTRFVTQDPYADCNADGQLTITDFGCFQTAFVLGCP